MSDAAGTGAMPRHTPLIFKLSVAAVLLAVFWPLPGMVAYSNPAEGTVLGRYTRLYALLLVAYLAVVVIWAAITVWVWRKVDAPRLARWQRWSKSNGSLLLAGFSLFSLGLFVYTFALWAQFIKLPAGVHEHMEIVPFLVYGIACLGIAAVFSPIITATDGDRPLGPGRMWGLLARYWHVVALIAASIAMTIVAFSRGLLFFPLYKDASAHLYIGQHLLHGGEPYRTVFYFHPPLRFAFSTLWAAVAHLSGLSPVPVARVFNLLLGVGMLGIAFAIGKGLTGQRYGGFLATLFFLNMPLLFILLVDYSPTLKLVASFLMALATLLAQHRRWLWGSVVTACAVLIWLPAGGLGLALIAVALLQRDEPLWPTLGKLALGAAIPLVVTAMALVASGSLIPALRQTVMGTFGFLIAGGASDGAAAAQSTSLIQSTKRFSQLVGGWGPMLLTVLAIPGLILRYGLRDLLQQPMTAAPVLAVLVMMALLSGDNVGIGDFGTLMGLIAPLMAAGIVPYIDAVRKWWRGLALVDWYVAYVALILLGMGLRSLAMIGSPPSILYADQVTAAADLNAALNPEDGVQCFDKLWFLVLTGRENALPIMQIDPKGVAANRAEGWEPEAIVQALAEDPPAVIMVPSNEAHLLSPWITESYISLGDRQVDASLSMYQAIYVRRGRDDLVNLIDNWPQSNNDSHEDQSS